MKMKLGKLIEQIRGVSYKPADLHNELDCNSVVLLRANNINEGKINFKDVVYVDKSKVKEEQYLRKGDIFICASSGSKHLVGKAAYISEDLKAVFGAFCKIVRLKNKDFAQYVGHYFDSPIYRTFMDNASQGTNINNIRNEDIEELEINWIDDISTQQKIVAKLDNLNLAIDKCKRLLELHDELIKSKFYEMFGDPEINNKLWQINKLGQISTIGSSHRVFTSEFVSNGVPFYRGTEISLLSKGIEPTEQYYISEEHYNSLIKDGSKPQIGDLLIPSICDKGQVWRVNTDKPFYYKDGRVLSISANRELFNTKYFQYYMHLKTEIEFPKLCYGSIFAEFKICILKNIDIIIPPLQLQTQFAQYVEIVEASKTKIKELQSRIEYLKASYMQEFFA